MVWSAAVAALCFLRSKVNAALNQDILHLVMLPAADQVFGAADLIFQQDLAPAHSAMVSGQWYPSS